MTATAARRFPPFIESLRAAIRDGSKTMTRRVMKNPPGEDERDEGYMSDIIARCPYGKVGDIRFLIEPLYEGHDGCARYRDDDALVISNVTGKPVKWRWKRWLLNSIHMPTEAARTYRELTDVRVERVQDISDEDAEAEMPYPLCYTCWDSNTNSRGDDTCDAMCGSKSYREEFMDIWNSINQKRGFGWGTNPFVWCVEFKRVEQSQ